MNVRNLNNKKLENQDNFKSLMLLDEISKGNPLSQRDMSKKLNIALGLVNSYIKNLIAKGYVNIKSIPSNKYAYCLTPKGFSEKSRLACHLLQDYTRIYREARGNLKKLFNELQKDGAQKIAFAGADEVAEIAYITLQETGMELTGIVDDEKAGELFFGKYIAPLKSVENINYDYIVITSYLKKDKIYKELLDLGVNRNCIKVIFSVWKGA